MHPCIHSQVRSNETHFGVVAPVLGSPRVTTATAKIYTEGAFLLRSDITRLMGSFVRYERVHTRLRSYIHGGTCVGVDVFIFVQV